MLLTEFGLKSGVQENKRMIPGEKLHDPTSKPLLRSSIDENEKTKPLLENVQKAFNFACITSVVGDKVVKTLSPTSVSI
jgi:hypothetical protein